MGHMGDVSIPLARSDGLLIEHVGDETVILDTETKEAHCLSPLAAAVFAGADGKTRVDDIAGLISSDEPVSVEQVYDAIAQLDERGLLDRPALPADPPSGISRRQLVRRTAGATAAFSAVPLVTSIVTPAFAQTSPGARCPAGTLCASQANGDVFCHCANACPPGSPGGGTECPGAGLGEGPSFDSCFCAKCPTPGDPNPGQVPAGFEGLCPNFTTTPPENCNGRPNAVAGCGGSTSDIDGICVPNDGDSSETCLDPGAP
jgi:hypothetical protein